MISETNNISLAKLAKKSSDTQWAFFPFFLENVEKEQILELYKNDSIPTASLETP